MVGIRVKVGELAADEVGDGCDASVAEAVVVGMREVGEGTGDEILEGDGGMAEAEQSERRGEPALTEASAAEEEGLLLG